MDIRSISGKILPLMFSIILLIVLELSVWATVSFFDIHTDIVVIHPNLGQEEIKKQIYVNDRYLLWKMKPNLRRQFVSPTLSPEGREPLVFNVVTNSKGFHGAEFHHYKEEGALRIVCMGNSSTFGWGVPPDSCYPRLMENMLEVRLGKDVEVINAGVPGYTTLQGLHQLVRNILPLAPDAITLSFTANDNLPSSRSDSEIILEREGIVGAAQEVLSHSHVYRVLRYLIVSKKVKKEMETDSSVLRRRVRPADSRKALRESVSRARASGAQVFFVEILPESQDWDPYRRILSDLSIEMSVPLLRTEELFADFLTDPEARDEYEIGYVRNLEKRYSEKTIARHPDIYVRLDRVHPSTMGHLLIAKSLSSILCDRLGAEAR
jgi:lysophospholipase L1-like esterase